MSNGQTQACDVPHGEQPHSAPPFGALLFQVINRGVAMAFHAVTRDGTLAAAFRQGAGEIGQALKAFPDSIHVQQPGTLLNPTQGEIADARDEHASNTTAREDMGTVHGQQAHHAVEPSPSDIIRGQASTAHGQQEGTVHGQQQGGGQVEPSPSDIVRGGSDGQVMTQDKPPGYWVNHVGRGNSGNQDGNAGSDQERPPDYWQNLVQKGNKGNQGGNAGNDQNEEGKGRSLPEEQQEKERDQGRGR